MSGYSAAISAMVSATFNGALFDRIGRVVVLAFIVISAVAAVLALLVETLTALCHAPAPQPKFDRMDSTGGYGAVRTACRRVQPGGCYVVGCSALGAGLQSPGPQQSPRSLPDMGREYGGYSSSPSQSSVDTHCSAPTPSRRRRSRVAAITQGPSTLPTKASTSARRHQIQCGTRLGWFKQILFSSYGERKRQ